MNGRADDIDFSSLLAAAKRLHISPDALAHHLHNCILITETTRDVLLAQLVNRSEIKNGKKARSSGKSARD